MFSEEVINLMYILLHPQWDKRDTRYKKIDEQIDSILSEKMKTCPHCFDGDLEELKGMLKFRVKGMMKDNTITYPNLWHTGEHHGL